MVRVRVVHDLDDLASDLAGIPVSFARRAPGVVAKSAREGNKLAQGFAREKSGPHGKNYYKRLSAEATGPLTWEYGPHDGGTPVGAGYRNGGVNLDLPNSADVIAPKFGDAVGKLADDLFDEAGF
jgi:hypothetical protein